MTSLDPPSKSPCPFSIASSANCMSNLHAAAAVHEALLCTNLVHVTREGWFAISARASVAACKVYANHKLGTLCAYAIAFQL